MRRLVTLVLLLGLVLGISSDSFARRARPTGFMFLFGATNSGILTSAGTRWYIINGPESSDAGTTEAGRTAIWPVAGIMSDLVVDLNGDVGAAGSSVAIAVRVNGADSGLTCTITGSTGTEANCRNSGYKLRLAAGDLIALQFVTVGTPNAAFPRWRIRWESDVLNVFPIIAVGTSNISSNADRFCSVNSCNTLGTIDAQVAMVMPVSGRLKTMWGRSGAAISSGNRVLTAVKNGVAQPVLAVTLNAGAQSAFDLSGDVHYVAGDTISWVANSADAATLTMTAGASWTFVPDDPGEFPVFAASSPSTTLVSYAPFTSGMSGINSVTETDTTTFTQALIVQRMLAIAFVAPGANASWRLGLFRSGFAPTSLDCTIADPATTCRSDAAQATESGESLTIRFTPSSTAPASGRVSVGFAVKPR